jgi:hypothetical protein
MEENRVFAGILQAPESSSNVSYRLCTAEVRGSNPLGSTYEKCCFAGLTWREPEDHYSQVKLLAAVRQQ